MLAAGASTAGFTAGLVFLAIIAAAAGVLAAVLVPTGRPPAGTVHHAH